MKTNKIKDMLLIFAKYTGGQVPEGLYSDIGKYFGVSREYIRQCANKLGFIPPRSLYVRKALCKFCTKPFTKTHHAPYQKFCNMKCYWGYRINNPIEYSFYPLDKSR